MYLKRLIQKGVLSPHLRSLLIVLFEVDTWVYFLLILYVIKFCFFIVAKLRVFFVLLMKYSQGLPVVGYE